MFAIGGHDGKKTLSSVEVYSQTTRQWAPLPDMRQPRMFPACAVLGERLYVVGGQCRLGVPLGSVEVFNLSLNQWEEEGEEEVGSLGVKLGSPAAVTHKNSLFVFGRGSGGTYDIHIYSSKTSNTWEIVHTTLPYHMYAEAVLCAGVVHILCGANSTRCKREGGPFVYRYDLETHQWSGVGCDMQCQRAGFSAAVVNGDIAVVGGHRGREKLASVDLYDPVSGEWQSLPEMCGGGRCVLGAVAVDQLALL